MNALVIDTNVISYIINHDSRGESYSQILGGMSASYISFITVAELRFGVRRRNWGAARRDALEGYLRNFAIYYPDEELTDLFVAVRLDRMAAGHPISMEDAIIAATALALGCPLVTHNVKDFRGITGLRLITTASE